ncbi:hypothetical protein TNCV_3776461 [Trichonephila clavipes]|nr:hypothetical protein TNCV_3776461 [Trichonephila clavipes]
MSENQSQRKLESPEHEETIEAASHKWSRELMHENNGIKRSVLIPLVALQDRTTSSWALSQKVDLFVFALKVTAGMVRRRLEQQGTVWKMTRIPGTMRYIGAWRSIRTNSSVSGSTEENAHTLHAFDIVIRALDVEC